MTSRMPRAALKNPWAGEGFGSRLGRGVCQGSNVSGPLVPHAQDPGASMPPVPLGKETRLWEGGSPPPGRAEGVSRLRGDLELLVPAGEDLFSLQLVKQVSLVFSPL